MNTMDRVCEIAEDRGLTMYKLAMLCEVSYSTLKNTQARGGQLTVDTIERICHGLNMTMAEFFTERGCNRGS
jgi:transcriptional regulator with XRE-family HTH domain